jgi:hypothetical protein
MDTEEKSLQDFKKEKDSVPRRSLQEILQRGLGSLAHRQGALVQPANLL